MSLKRNPVYTFDTKDSKGIHELPDSSLFVVEDYNGKTSTFFKMNSIGLTSNSTVSQAAEAGSIKTLDADITINNTSSGGVDTLHTLLGTEIL